jgi:hypothetical protein
LRSGVFSFMACSSSLFTKFVALDPLPSITNMA